MEDDFFSLYLEYAGQNESPVIFHRWSAITALAAYVGRNFYFHHGHFTYYPNQYVMLIGSPGTKKSSAIKIASSLIKKAGFNSFAAKKTRQEKFLRDLADISKLSSGPAELDSIIDKNLFGGDADSATDDYESALLRPPAECFISADEFNNFLGVGNLEFAAILGELWDYEGVFDYKLQSSASVYIPNPTINILGGNTPTAFSAAFPPEAIGQGWFSRLLLIYGEKQEHKRITFPPKPDPQLQDYLIKLLVRIKANMVGESELTPEAVRLVEQIYMEREGIDDVRFEAYENRRLPHLLKLSILFAAARLSLTVDVQDIVYANTVLTYAENLMPKALGEFGAAKNSKVAHKIITLLESNVQLFSILDIWRHVHQDLERREQLVEILANLVAAGKIMFQKADNNRAGYLPVKRRQVTSDKCTLDWKLLTEEELIVGGLDHE